MIRYVQNKPIDYDAVQKLLANSERAHAFTNNGPVKRQLEQRLEKLFQIGPSDRRVVCTSSGTSALYVLMSLFEKLAGRPLSWVTHAYNFPATQVTRLNTQVVDIDPNTHTIPLQVVKDYDGVIVPTLFGTIKGIATLHQHCLDYGKILILDNASSPLTSLEYPHRRLNINLLGSACVGSLHHTKYLGFGEGGFAIVRPDLYDELSYLTNFGFDDARNYNILATNAKMSDIAAAFILNHIDNYDLGKHIQTTNQYLALLNDIDMQPYNYSDGVVYGNLPILFDKPTDHLAFRDVGIEANKYYKPLKPFPHAMNLYRRMINLPLHASLTQYDLEIILKKVKHEAQK